jgi:hypothetical protein
MAMALNPGDRPIDLLIAGGAMPIPRSHPAYCGDVPPSRFAAARRWSATVAMVAGLLSIAAFSGGAAHYMLRLAEPRNEASFAVAKLPEPPPQIAASAPASAPTITAPTSSGPTFTGPTFTGPAPAFDTDAAETAPSAEPAAVLKKPAKRSIKSAKLLAHARRQKPATVLDGENIAFAPRDEIVPAPMLPAAEPLPPTPRANR